MATIDSVKTKLRNLLSSLSTKMGTTYTTFTAAINDLPSKKTASDIEVSGRFVEVTSGIYYSDYEVGVPAGSAATPATSFSVTVTPTIDENGKITATASDSKSITPTVTAGYVSSGTAGTVSVSGSGTLQLTTQAAKTVTPTTSNQTAVASGRYTTGAVTVKGDANLVPDNIKSGSSIFGVVGTYGGGGNVQTTSVIIDTWNTMSDGYGVDVYYTILENGQPVTAHQYVETFKDVVLGNNVVMGSVITFKSDLYLDDYTNMLFGEATQNYQWAYAYKVSEGAYFMFWE